MIMIKGQTNSITIEVKKQHLANVVGSGELEVLATPAMIAFMEKAASQLVSDQLEEGQTSVGTLMNVEHTSASPLGMKVTVTATVTGVDGRKIDFEVIARDEKGEIGKGVHTRFIVDSQRFMSKVSAKLEK